MKKFIIMLLALAGLTIPSFAAATTASPVATETEKEAKAQYKPLTVAFPASSKVPVRWSILHNRRVLATLDKNIMSGVVMPCLFWRNYLHMDISPQKGAGCEALIRAAQQVQVLNGFTKTSLMFPAPLKKDGETGEPVKSEGLYQLDEEALKGMIPDGFSPAIGLVYEMEFKKAQALLAKFPQKSPEEFPFEIRMPTFSDEAVQDMLTLMSAFSTNIVKREGVDVFKNSVHTVLAENGLIFLCYQGRKPVGILGAMPFEEAIGEKRVLVDTLYVDESVRHRGIALALLDAFFKILAMDPPSVLEWETGKQRLDARKHYEAYAVPTKIAIRDFLYKS